MFGFRKYQSGGQVDEYQQLEDYVRQYKDYISNWVTQRPSVTRTYDDLLKDVTERNIKLNKYSKEDWEQHKIDLNEPRLGAYYSGDQIYYPEGGEGSIPHELFHYFAGHKSGSRGVPEVNKYQEQDIKWKGWLPSLHPAGRRPTLPGWTGLGRWWNEHFATQDTEYSDENEYHPWFDEHAYDRVPRGDYPNTKHRHDH